MKKRDLSKKPGALLRAFHFSIYRAEAQLCEWRAMKLS